MAIVLALVIIGWLAAFTLGAQAGFDDTSAAAQPIAQSAPVASQQAISQERTSAA